MWIAILLVVLGVIGILVFRTRQRKTPPQDTYVCDVCGEKECVCHKEGRKT
jgi:hypothetical protein